MAHRSVAAEDAGPEPGRPPPRLVLASEALREEVAPREPGARAARFIVAGVAVVFGLLGLAMRFGIDVSTTGSGASVSLAAAGAAAALAILPFPYFVRALAVALLGAFLMLLGVAGTGPLAGLALGRPAGNAARALTLGCLPGALLFRARYRAYPRARLVLGVGLAVAVPFLIGRGLVFTDASSPLLDRGGSALDIAVTLAGLLGFMGEHTTAGGSVWAALVLFVLPADLVLGDLGGARHHLPGAPGWLADGGTAVGTASAATLLALGGYQALAAWLGADARREAKARANGGP